MTNVPASIKAAFYKPEVLRFAITLAKRSLHPIFNPVIIFHYSALLVLQESAAQQTQGQI